MFFASIGFAWSFPPRDYMTGEPPGFWRNLWTLFDLTDVVDDVQGAPRSTPARAPRLAAVRLPAPAHIPGSLRDTRTIHSALASVLPHVHPHASELAPMCGACADRVHEEYREITTRPIQKIIAPLRNTALFGGSAASKGRLISLQTGAGGGGGDEIELVPLAAGGASTSAAASGVPGVSRIGALAGMPPAARGAALLSPGEMSGRGKTNGGGGSGAGSSASLFPALDREQSSKSADAAVGASSATALPESGGAFGGGASSPGALGNGKGVSRGSLRPAKKLQSHVD
jgi:hypothetical protein